MGQRTAWPTAQGAAVSHKSVGRGPGGEATVRQYTTVHRRMIPPAGRAAPNDLTSSGGGASHELHLVPERRDEPGRDGPLSAAEVGRTTDVYSPGRVSHTTPLWYVWDGEALWFEIGAGERPRQHLRNLRSHPRLCVMIDRDARPEQGRVFDAQGVLIRGTVELSIDETLQKEVSRKVLRRYLGDEGE